MPTPAIQKSTMNCLGNSQNPWQGERKKVLCCCSAGLLRSPTTAQLLNQKYGFNTRAVGLEADYALTLCTEAMVYWADEIVVQNQGQARDIEYLIQDMPEYAKTKALATPVKVLGIEDSYAYMDEDLQKLILSRYGDPAGEGSHVG